MINMTMRIPAEVAVGWSGGVDSMAVVDFLSRRHKLTVIYVNHHTPHSEYVSSQAKSLLERYDVDFYEHSIDPIIPKDRSVEEHWRMERYKAFHSYDMPVITCHHLDDCVETWIWSSLNGQGKIIPETNGNVIRPFRPTPKSKFIEWAQRKDVKWIEDNSNKDNKYIRNYIRNEMMPHVLKVNPGIQKVIKKKVLNE